MMNKVFYNGILTVLNYLFLLRRERKGKGFLVHGKAMAGEGIDKRMLTKYSNRPMVHRNYDHKHDRTGYEGTCT